MLWTMPRWRSRSMKISATRSSSRMATIVSWLLEEMIISLLMREAPHAGDGYARRDEHEQARHDVSADRDRPAQLRAAAPRIGERRDHIHDIPHRAPALRPARSLS